MSGPIKPSEVESVKTSSIPEEVFEAFNELIASSFNGRESCVLQHVALDRIVHKFLISGKEVTKDAIVANHWLDVEPSYRGAGWSVIYDKPGYNETYEANFTFRKKKS